MPVSPGKNCSFRGMEMGWKGGDCSGTWGCVMVLLMAAAFSDSLLQVQMPESS